MASKDYEQSATPTGDAGQGDGVPESSGAIPQVLGPEACEDGQQLVLVKDGQRYVFRYSRGQEHSMLAGLVEMVRDPNSKLGWFDAAVVSHRLGCGLRQELDRLMKPA